jgi:peptide deformylase
MAAERGIVFHPSPVLRQKARPVARVDGFVAELVRDMHRVAREYDGIGLAAPQVGESLRIFVTCALYGEPERVFINPRLELSGAITGGDEGCLSLPEIRAEIMRPPQARITALDLEGNEFTMERDGIWARVWQHEHDHLEGTLIIDRMRPLDRLANRRAIRDLERAVDGGRGR